MKNCLFVSFLIFIIGHSQAQSNPIVAVTSGHYQFYGEAQNKGVSPSINFIGQLPLYRRMFLNFQYNLGTFNLYSQKNIYKPDINFGIKEDIKIKSKLSGCQINLGYAFISKPRFNISTTVGVGLYTYKSQSQFLDMRDSLRSKDNINQTTPNPNFMQRVQETGNTKSMTYNLGLQSEINLTPATCLILGAQYTRAKNDDIDLLKTSLSINQNWDSYLQLQIGLALKIGGDGGGGCCTLCQIGCMPWGCRRHQNTLYLKKKDPIKTSKTTFSM